MPKYVLTTRGEVKKYVVSNNEVINIQTEENLSSLIPLKKDVNAQSNKPVVDATNNLFPLSENIIAPVSLDNRKQFFVSNSKDLVNKSFNFMKKEDVLLEKSDEDFEGVEYYIPYNSVFDLDINERANEVGLQIFADDIDQFGFSSLTKDPVSFANDNLLRIMTLVDIFIPALIPIAIISGLELLAQTSYDTKKYNLEYGKYITYNFSFEGKIDVLSDVIEINLNVIQRLMNFPKIKRKENENFLSYILKPFVYLLIGYMSYITPGLQFDIPTKFTDLLSPTFWSNVLTSILNADTPKHIYNLLIKKIAKSKYFFEKTYNTQKDKNFLTTFKNDEVADSFQLSLAQFGTFFYRFIGERIAIGEKQWLIDSSKKNKDKSFYATRKSEIDNKEKNVLLSNFAYSNKEIVLEDYKKRHEKYKNVNDNIKNEQINEKRLFEEAKINVEYMPFSFHDIRTNIIKTFHAYLENISDGFSPNYTDTSGFGRMDPVKIYNGTSRSISVDFWLISTNKDDIKKMWEDINWLVNLLYPVWSENEDLEQPDFEKIKKSLDPKRDFVSKPFTRIPVASPLIRLRIGNLIISTLGKKQLEYNTHQYVSSSNTLIDEGTKLFDITKGRNVINTTTTNSDIDRSNLIFPHYFLKNKTGFTNLLPDQKNQINLSFANYNYHENPFAKSEIRTGGVGLPGVIKSLNVVIDQNSLWDIEADIKLPTTVKITMQFDPVHDFKPGMITFTSSSISDKFLSTHRNEIYPETI